MLDFLEEIIPSEVEIFLFVSKECKGKYTSKRIKIKESNYSKYLCFMDFRNFCKRNKIERVFSMGALPQEGFLMLFASLFKKMQIFCHMVVNPFLAYKTGLNSAAIKAFFEYLLLYPLVFFLDRYYVAVKDITDYSKKRFSFAKHKIFFLQFPVDTIFFKPKDKMNSRKKLGLPLKSKIVLYVGRIEYEKGSDILLSLSNLNK